MKRILTLFLLLPFFVQLPAQQAKTPERRPVWLGLNFGSTFQTSDMKPLGGIGWGATLAQYTRISNPSPLYFGWRLRFLDGRNFGYNYHEMPAAGIQNNPALTTAPTNYSDSAGVFGNYKMRFDEYAFELIVGSNGLRKHGVLLYAFGAAGLNHWRTTTNQRDEFFGNQYNYSSITGNGNMASVHQQLNFMWDKTYETNANGSGNKAQWSFMPSVGIGFGYQWGNVFAIGAEFRTTFALNDVIDGVNTDANGQPTPQNDIYNYAGGFIRFGIGGGHSSTHRTTYSEPPSNPNNYTQHPVNTTTTVVTAPPPPPPPPGGGGQQAPIYHAPYVSFITPSVDPYTTTVPTQQLVVHIDYIESPSQINLVINNHHSSNFSFNPSTGTMVFSTTLLSGTNTFNVSATNNAGTGSDAQTIIYSVNPSNYSGSQLPPHVTIDSPSSDPYTSSTPNANVTATVLNVASSADIQVRDNGTPLPSFYYNAGTHLVTFSLSLANGNNLVEVIGTNSVGSASDAVNIIYNHVEPVMPPVVTITSPAYCPFMTKSTAMTISANITNVTSAAQVNIVYNSHAVTVFNFHDYGNYASVSFPATLQPGVNNVTITGTNTAGSDSKSCSVTSKQQFTPPPAQPPQVTITSPPSNPYTSSVQSLVLSANVLYVDNSSEITVRVNNVPTSAFVYNISTKVLTLALNLANGTTVVNVAASNSAGSDSKTETIVYNPPPSELPPVVHFTQPLANPYITNVAQQTMVAEVLNITSSNQISVTNITGSPLQFSFNPATHLVTFTQTLVSGANPFTVTATNSAGTASDSRTLKLQEEQSGTGVGGSGNSSGQGSGSGNPQPAPQVTITSPSANPYTSTGQSLLLAATVLNVNSSSEITVTVNNAPTSGFTYSTVTKVLNLALNLGNGSTVVGISASNSAGSDSKTETIVYNSQPTELPPVVHFTQPAANPYITNVAQQTMVAEVLNISSSSDIRVTNITGGQVPFSFNSSTHLVTFSQVLVSGANPYTVTATNSAGSASDSRTLKLQEEQSGTGAGSGSGGSQPNSHGSGSGSSQQSPGNPHSTSSAPSGSNASGGNPNSSSSSSVAITLVVPSGDNYSTSSSPLAVTMEVTGVSSSAEIAVRVNGMHIPFFNFNAATHTLSFSADFIAGNNTIEVSAQSNSGNGSATKTLHVLYNAPQEVPGNGRGNGNNSGGHNAPAPHSGNVQQNTPHIQTSGSPSSGSSTKQSSGKSSTSSTHPAPSSSGKAPSGGRQGSTSSSVKKSDTQKTTAPVSKPEGKSAPVGNIPRPR